MKQSIFLVFFILGSFIKLNDATNYCPDPLNKQPPASNRIDDATPVSGGVATCVTGTNCAIVISTGQGICTTASTPSTTSPFFVIASTSSTSAASAPASINLLNGLIATCWNPSGNNQVTTSPAVGATNAILACQTTRAGVGSPVYQTVGGTTTASTAVSLNTAGNSYCFTTNCNIGLYVSSNGKIQMNLLLIFVAILSAILLY